MRVDEDLPMYGLPLHAWYIDDDVLESPPI